MALSITYTVLSGGYNGIYYYGSTGNNDYKTYTVRITGYSTDGETLRSIQLKIGSRANTRSSTGTLEIPLNASGTFTPTLTLTTTSGNSKTYSLSSITVREHTNPTIDTYIINSTSPYYEDKTSYSVNCSEVTIDNSDKIGLKALILTVGNSSDSRTSTGTLATTISGSGDITPYLRIVDDLDASRTYSLSAISVLANTTPSLTYQVFTTESTVSQYSYYQIAVNSITCDSWKTYSISLAIGSQTHTIRSTGRYGFRLTTTGSNITPTLTITDSEGKSQSYSLPSITIYAARQPSIQTSVLSTAPYYAGYDSYTVHVVGTAYDGKYVEQISLFINGQYVSLLGNTTIRLEGDLTIIVPTDLAGRTVTPQVTVYDSEISRSTTLSAITILENNPPTVDDPVVLTTSPYYAESSAYSVSVSNALADTGKSIAENGIILRVGDQTAAISTNGTVSINPLNAANHFVPTLTVVDNKGQSITKPLPQITVLPNAGPTCNYVINSTAPYNPGISTYSITISNLEAKGDKTIATNGVVLQIGNQTAQRSNNGTLTISLNTLGTFTPILTITDSIGTSTTISLPQISVTSYARIKTLESHRIDSTSHKILDTGTDGCMVVEFEYLNTSGNYFLEPIVNCNNLGTGETLTVTWYTGWNRTTGVFSGQITNWSNYRPTSPITLYAHLSKTNGFIHSQTYSLAVTPVTTHFPNGGTTATTKISQAFFLLVGKAGGHALGIGMKPSQDNVLDVSMSTHIYNNLTVDDDITIGDDAIIQGDLTTQGYIHANGTVNSETNILKGGVPLISPYNITLAAEDWNNKQQIVSVPNVTTTNNIIIISDLSNAEAYTDSEVMCVAQNTNELTFQCDLIPEVDLLVNLLILN